MLSSPQTSVGNRRTLLLIGALVAVVALGALAVGGVLYASGQAGQPGLVLSRYCADLTQQNYTDGYGTLSDGARAHLSQAQYVQQQQTHDLIDGQVKSCSAPQAKGGGLNLNFGQTSASLSATLTRAQTTSTKTTSTKTTTGTVSLVRQADGWKIDKLDAALQGTDLGPLLVAQHFCAALAQQDYTGAYGDLSGRQHAGTTQDAFTKAYTQALGDASAKITGCTPTLSSYTVQAATAALDVVVQLQISGGTTPVPVPFHIALVHEGGAWKIDAITAVATQ
jgi:hypothetical protein